MPDWGQWVFLIAASLLCRLGARTLAARITARLATLPAEPFSAAPRWLRSWQQSRSRLTPWFFVLRGGVLFALLMTLWQDLASKYLGFPLPLDPSWGEIGTALVTRLLGGVALMWAIWLINEFRFLGGLGRLVVVDAPRKEQADGAESGR